MTKKNRHSGVKGLDIPPVPASTRYQSSSDSEAQSYLEPWIGQLIGIEYVEIEIPRDQQGMSRLFIDRKRGVATHFINDLVIPGMNRPSYTQLGAIGNEVLLISHLAIAAEETKKAALETANTDARQTAIISQMIVKQDPEKIIESARFEQAVVDEALSGSPWGAAFLAHDLMRMNGSIDRLCAPLKNALALGELNSPSYAAGRSFVEMFAAQQLGKSSPKLAQYSATLIPAGVQQGTGVLTQWCNAVALEWQNLTLHEWGTAILSTPEEQEQFSAWLGALVIQCSG